MHYYLAVCAMAVQYLHGLVHLGFISLGYHNVLPETHFLTIILWHDCIVLSCTNYSYENAHYNRVFARADAAYIRPEKGSNTQANTYPQTRRPPGKTQAYAGKRPGVLRCC